MIISENWLREWVEFDLDFNSLPALLTAAGLETGVVEDIKALPKSVVAGHVVKICLHPDATGLTLCDVDTGDAKPVRVVCGAPNVALGTVAPFARIGSQLPAGQKIVEVVIRGEPSSGMLCSAAELGLEEQSQGLLLLDPELSPGGQLNEHLQLPDRLLEVELTPNRGDCLSILGVAREVAALTGGLLKEPKLPRVRATELEARSISLDADGRCARYVGRSITGIRPGARTPDRIRERVTRAGLRSIDALVDVSNYIMLELGQPMHAFDGDRLKGNILVRPANPKEKIKLLDGERLALDAESLLITDQNGPVALAGIKGGASTMIHSKTHTVFLEAAFFDPDGIARTARKYGLNTDASHRFERGVDFSLPAKAIERASTLVVQICGGRCGPRIESSEKSSLPRRAWVPLRLARLSRMLGERISKKKVLNVFISLGMKCEPTQSGWRVKAPTYRFDVAAEHDLVEEVARVVGYDRLPVNRPKVAVGYGLASESKLTIERAKDLLVDLGYREAITYSFVSPDLQKHFHDYGSPITLKNPISVHMAQMRLSLLPGLLVALAANARRQIKDVRLFETGHTYQKKKKSTEERQRVAALLAGAADQHSWDQQIRPVDFFDVKGHVERILRLTFQGVDAEFLAIDDEAYQTGQCAKIRLRGKEIGRVGRISPGLLEEAEIVVPVFGFELDWAEIEKIEPPSFKAVSRFPTVARDISIVIPEKTVAADAATIIKSAASELLVQLELIDLYTDTGIETGKKSLTFRLTLQSNSRNLTDEEADHLIDAVLKRLSDRIGAELRSR